MICKKCGSNVELPAKFCVYCGALLDGGEIVQVPVDQPAVLNQVNQSIQPNVVNTPVENPTTLNSLGPTVEQPVEQTTVLNPINQPIDQPTVLNPVAPTIVQPVEVNVATKPENVNFTESSNQSIGLNVTNEPVANVVRSANDVEKTKKKKNNTWIIVVLVILVLGLGGYLIYDKVIDKIGKEEVKEESDKQNEIIEQKEYTYESIKGLYKNTTETTMNVDDEKINLVASYNLYLYDNGTFNYRYGTMTRMGYIGNYIIKDNTIILNYLFSTGNDMGISVTNGSKTLIINEDGSITDNKQDLTTLSLTSIILEKTTANEENEFLNENDFSKVLNDYYISNNATNKQ